MFCGPRAGPYRFDIKLDLRFYDDQLYNPHANEYYELYENFTPRGWKVWGSLTSPAGSELVRRFLSSHSLCSKWWDVRFQSGRRVGARDCAWHQIKVLVPMPVSWFNDTLHARNYVFKVIRARVCRQWLARVRVHIGRAPWCDDGVATVIVAQLEAWFAAVPHEEVQWSEYDDWLRRYRVIQW